MDSSNKISDLSINSSNQGLGKELRILSHEQVLSCTSAATEDSSIEISVKNSDITGPLTNIPKSDSSSVNLTKSQLFVENRNTLSKETSFDSDSEKLESEINFRSPETLSENLIQSDSFSCSSHEKEHKSLTCAVSKFYNNYDFKSPELSSTSSDSSRDLDLVNCLISKNDLDKISKCNVEEFKKDKYALAFEENKFLKKGNNTHSSKLVICPLNDDANFVSNALSPTEVISLPDKESEESNSKDELKNFASGCKNSRSLNIKDQSNLQSHSQNKTHEIPLPVSIVNFENTSKGTSFRNILETNSSNSECVLNKFKEKELDFQETIPPLELAGNKSESCITEKRISPSANEPPGNENNEFGSLVTKTNIAFPACHNIKSVDDASLDLHKDSVHSFIEDDDNIYAVAENISITAEDNADSLPYDSDHDMESDLSLKFHDDSSSPSEDETLLNNIEDCHTEKVGETKELNIEPINSRENSILSDTMQQEKTQCNLTKSKEMEENVHSDLPQNSVENIEELNVKESFISKSEKVLKINDFSSDPVEAQFLNSKSCSGELECNISEKSSEASKCLVGALRNVSPLLVPNVIDNNKPNRSTGHNNEEILQASSSQNFVTSENNAKEPCDMDVDPTINQSLGKEIMVSSIEEPLCKDKNVNLSKENENLDDLEKPLTSTNLSKSIHIEETDSDTSSECMIENITNASPLSEVVAPNVIDSRSFKESTSKKNEEISHTNLGTTENNIEELHGINVDLTINHRLEKEFIASSIKESLYKENENIDGLLQESLTDTNLSKDTHIEETESDSSTDISESSVCTVEKSENILNQKSPSSENLEIKISHDSLLTLPIHEEVTTCNERVNSPVKSSSTHLLGLSRKSNLMNESEDIEMENSFDNLGNETVSATTSAVCQITTNLTPLGPKNFENTKNINSIEKSVTPCLKENIPSFEEIESLPNIVIESVKATEGLVIPNSQKGESDKTESLDEERNLNVSPPKESLESKSLFYISGEKKLQHKSLCESSFDPNDNENYINSMKEIELTNTERKSEEQVIQDINIRESECIKNNDHKESDIVLLQESSVKEIIKKGQLPEVNDSFKTNITIDLEAPCCDSLYDIIKKNNEQLKDLDTDLNENQSLLLGVETYFRKKEDLNVSGQLDVQQEFLSKGNFDWDDFLEKTISESPPPTAFLHVERSIETGVHVNQVLEVLIADEKDSTNSSSTWLSYWPAKVVSSCGSLLRLKYLVSAQSTSSNTYGDFWCDLSNPKIRPIGWSNERNIPMQPPPEFQSESDSILNEETLTTLNPVPEEAFDCEKRELYNRLLEGMLLEVLDLQNPYDGRIVKVVKNVGGRLLLSDTEETVNLRVKNSFWLFFLDKRIRPLGWIYKQGEPYRYKNSNFNELLKDCGETTDRGTSFLTSFNSSFSNHNLEEGMHLEAFNPINFQSIHAAIVSKVLDDSYFELKFDDHSWVTTIEDPLIVPCGFAEENCLDLIPPNNYSQEGFTWKNYNALRDSLISSSEAFPKHTLSSELGFDVGQKLEVASPLDPNQICIATIERVLQHILLLKLDSNPNFLFYRAAASMDNFPAGWAHSHFYPLAVPYWYVEHSRNPSVNQNEESDILPDNNMVMNIEKSPWTNYNSLWCPRLYINHCCYPGPYLSKIKVSKMSKSVGPGPLPLVLHDVISMTINSAYIPTRVLRELQNLKKRDSSWQSIPSKAKFKRHILKAGVNIPSLGKDVPIFLLEFSKILISCENLWSFDNIGENCPLVCNKQNMPMISSGNAMHRGRGGIRGSFFRRKKGSKKRLFYPIKPSANNNEENTEEFCYPDEGEEVEEVISESEGESRPSSPASSDVQRKSRPKRILSSLEITMNDSRSCDIIKERSTKRSRGDFETDISSRQQTTSCLRTEDISGDRKKARIEEKNDIEAEAEVEAEAEAEAEAVIYGLETAQVDTDPLEWSIDDVQRYVSSQPDISHHAVKLKEQEVDGRALLLLNLPSLIHHMGLPHSVAVILAQHICKVKMAHFVNFYSKDVKKVT